MTEVKLEWVAEVIRAQSLTHRQRSCPWPHHAVTLTSLGGHPGPGPREGKVGTLYTCSSPWSPLCLAYKWHLTPFDWMVEFTKRQSGTLVASVSNCDDMNWVTMRKLFFLLGSPSSLPPALRRVLRHLRACRRWNANGMATKGSGRCCMCLSVESRAPDTKGRDKKQNWRENHFQISRRVKEEPQYLKWFSLTLNPGMCFWWSLEFLSTCVSFSIWFSEGNWKPLNIQVR